MAELREHLQAKLGEGFTIDRELGGGGMSRVFVATDRALGREVVIKVLPPELGAAVNVERFRREIQFAARLQHPHIVPLLSAGEIDGLPYFTMPFVEGESLRARLAREGELPVAVAVRILREVAIALGYAHDHGVVHRDIKPENVLLSGVSSSVTDFGVAKAISASADERPDALTSAGVSIGSPAYMAPEQAVADPTVDHRVDIYAFGVMAYEMLAGNPPFTGRSVQAIIAAHVVEAPEPITIHRPAIPYELSELIDSCLEKKPADRPQSAAEIVRRLETVPVASGEGTARLPAAAATAARSGSAGGALKRYRWPAAAVAILAVAAIGYGVRSRSAGLTNGDRPMVAVLPFENLGEADDEYFADGISEEITSRLSRVSGIGVISRGSASHYKKSPKSLREIARELGVTYVLTGTVRWDKSKGVSRVRVSPELVRISDQQNLWSEPYEADLADVFSLQSSIAERVAQALDIRLRPQEKTEIAARPTQNLDAYDCYLRGRAALERNVRLTREGRAEAVKQLDCAVSKDPNFAAAHAALAQANVNVYASGDDVSSGRLDAARREAIRATELDPRSATARMSLVNYYIGRGDAAAARKELSAAIALDSTNPAALIALARSHARRGELDAALATYSRVVALDPRNLDAIGEIAGMYDFKHDYESAIRIRDREMSLSPENAFIYEGNAYSYILWRGDTAAARREFQRGVANAGIRRMLGSFSYIGNFTSMPRELTLAIDTGSLATLGRPKPVYYAVKASFFLFRGKTPLANAYAESTVVAARSLDNPATYGLVYRYLVAISEAILGRRADAIARMDKVVEAAAKEGQINLARALLARASVHATLGDAEKALDDLERGRKLPGLVSPHSLRLDWRFASLRANPRFLRLVQPE